MSSESSQDLPFIPRNINALANWGKSHITYKDDEEVWGKQYGQSSKETLALRTGDCEDYAQLFADIATDWGEESYVFTVVWINKKKHWPEGHAVAVIKMNRKIYLLDEKCTPLELDRTISNEEIADKIASDWAIYTCYMPNGVAVDHKVRKR